MGSEEVGRRSRERVGGRIIEEERPFINEITIMCT